MTAQERKSIFAFCRELGIGEDDRHALIYSVTGKESTTELTSDETHQLIHELTERLKLKNPLEERKPRAYKPQVAGMITINQQRMAWALIYRLMELDGVAVDKSMAGKRMAGAIRKELGVTTVVGEDIFRWVSFDDGAKLIEKLKMYVRSAERRTKRTG